MIKVRVLVTTRMIGHILDCIKYVVLGQNKMRGAAACAVLIGELFKVKRRVE